MPRRRRLLTLAALVPVPAFALYDPKPNALLASAPGAWTGSLTYRDWSQPDKLVTLPCRLSVALSAPEELALFYVFDDGPGKVVYSYERMSFDFTAGGLSWVSGSAKPETSRHAITGTSTTADGAQILFERMVDDRTDRHVLALGARAMSLTKTEHRGAGTPTLRNRYEFRRGEG